MDNPHQEWGVCIMGPRILKSKARAHLEESNGEPEERYPEEFRGKMWIAQLSHWPEGTGTPCSSEREVLRLLLRVAQQSKCRTTKEANANQQNPLTQKMVLVLCSVPSFTHFLPPLSLPSFFSLPIFLPSSSSSALSLPASPWHSFASMSFCEKLFFQMAIKI